jgi:hypothetical protein
MFTSDILHGEYQILYILFTSWSFESSALPLIFILPSLRGPMDDEIQITYYLVYKHPVALTYLFCVDIVFPSQMQLII